MQSSPFNATIVRSLANVLLLLNGLLNWDDCFCRSLERAGFAFVESNRIFVTSDCSSETTIQAMRLGAFDYLAKPINLEQLRKLTDCAVDDSPAKGTLSSGWPLLQVAHGTAAPLSRLEPRFA